MTVFSRPLLAGEPALALPPRAESLAYKQYQKQPKSELSKINYLFNRLGQAKAQVIYDGHEYEMPEVIKIAKDYFYRHYHQETADYWVKNYCYKSDQGNVIMFKTREGNLKPARDIVLQELTALERMA